MEWGHLYTTAALMVAMCEIYLCQIQPFFKTQASFNTVLAEINFTLQLVKAAQGCCEGHIWLL